jgi:hypothetical protein
MTVGEASSEFKQYIDEKGIRAPEVIKTPSEIVEDEEGIRVEDLDILTVRKGSISSPELMTGHIPFRDMKNIVRQLANIINTLVKTRESRSVMSEIRRAPTSEYTEAIESKIQAIESKIQLAKLAIVCARLPHIDTMVDNMNTVIQSPQSDNIAETLMSNLDELMNRNFGQNLRSTWIEQNLFYNRSVD